LNHLPKRIGVDTLNVKEYIINNRVSACFTRKICNVNQRLKVDILEPHLVLNKARYLLNGKKNEPSANSKNIPKFKNG
jgi:hypothetical protein